MKLVAVIGYVVVMLGILALFNADAENNFLALAVWSAASLVIGWVMRDAWAVVLSLLALPMAVPFGYADQWLGSDAPYVWWLAMSTGAIQVIVVFAAVLGRLLYERIHSSRA